MTGDKVPMSNNDAAILLDAQKGHDKVFHDAEFQAQEGQLIRSTRWKRQDAKCFAIECGGGLNRVCLHPFRVLFE